MKKINVVKSIDSKDTREIFITCASFEERFLGIPKIIKSLNADIIMFKYNEENLYREKNINSFKNIIKLNMNLSNFHTINLFHNKEFESIIELNRIINNIIDINEIIDISIDLSTFTKVLLISTLSYIRRFLKLNRIRFLYSSPKHYASPNEGSLSYGITDINLTPLCWGSFSPIKKNLLITILGFEENRALSIIENFSADLNWVYISSPGTNSEWDKFCEQYNKKLINKYPIKNKISAIDINEVSEKISSDLNQEIINKYNVYIAPLGTKPQIIGLILISESINYLSFNFLTTSVINHNIPYYSWGIGDTFEYIYSFSNLQKNII